MFRDRDDAGRALALILGDLRPEHPVVIGLPRGGVPVAAVVADALDASLDVIVVRKVGVPGAPEFAVGALAEESVRILDAALVARLGIPVGDVEAVERHESAVLAERSRALHRIAPAVPLEDRTAVIVDDGLATGSTARAACRAARARGARRVIVAVPCAPSDARAAALEADELRAVETSSAFGAVGQFYADFSAVEDETVAELLRAARAARPRPDAAPA